MGQHFRIFKLRLSRRTKILDIFANRFPRNFGKVVIGGSVNQWLGRLPWAPEIPVQDPLWPLVEFDPGSPWFNFPAALVNSQLVCLRPVGSLTSCCCCYSVPSFRCVSLALKSPYGERSIKYVLLYGIRFWGVLKKIQNNIEERYNLLSWVIVAVILDIYNFYHFHQRLFENHTLIKQKSPKIVWDKRKTTYCKVLFLFLFFFYHWDPSRFARTFGRVKQAI